MNFLIRNARVLTLASLAGGAGPRRGKALGDLGVLARGDVRVRNGKIEAVGERLGEVSGAVTIEAEGRVLMPGFVDCHTHACWAGDRLDEWEMKRRGVPYLEILKAGGGIHATVRAVRAASEDQLESNLQDRLGRMMRAGTTTVEVKSGYGLTTEAEIKMLRAIARVAKIADGTVIPTALLGHAVEGDPGEYARAVVNEMLPAVSAEFPGVAIDAFCEQGAWSVENCVKLFERARPSHAIRVHADQFNSLGMTPAAVRLGARSVDHLEASTEADLSMLASSSTMGVILPCTGFHTDQRYARGGYFLEKGGALALATNCNPGSAPTHAMPFAIALAVRYCGLSPAEAIAACTVNAAAVLGLSDRGRIEPGLRADLILLHHRDERELAHEFGGNPVSAVFVGGNRVAGGTDSS